MVKTISGSQIVVWKKLVKDDNVRLTLCFMTHNYIIGLRQKPFYDLNTKSPGMKTCYKKESFEQLK